MNLFGRIYRTPVIGGPCDGEIITGSDKPREGDSLHKAHPLPGWRNVYRLLSGKWVYAGVEEIVIELVDYGDDCEGGR